MKYAISAILFGFTAIASGLAAGARYDSSYSSMPAKRTTPSRLACRQCKSAVHTSVRRVRRGKMTPRDVVPSEMTKWDQAHAAEATQCGNYVLVNLTLDEPNLVCASLGYLNAQCEADYVNAQCDYIHDCYSFYPPICTPSKNLNRSNSVTSGKAMKRYEDEDEADDENEQYDEVEMLVGPCEEVCPPPCPEGVGEWRSGDCQPLSLCKVIQCCKCLQAPKILHWDELANNTSFSQDVYQTFIIDNAQVKKGAGPIIPAVLSQANALEIIPFSSSTRLPTTFSRPSDPFTLKFVCMTFTGNGGPVHVRMNNLDIYLYNGVMQCIQPCVDFSDIETLTFTAINVPNNGGANVYIDDIAFCA